VKVVYVARDITDAGIVRGMLEANGIAVEMRGEAMSSVRGLLPYSREAAPKVCVEERDYERAMALIDQAVPQSGAAWTCGQCGERVDAELGECWQCGTTRVSPVPEA
jgi:hypothetical protein